MGLRYPMKITCISCGSMFYLDNSHVKFTGSLVRCSKCDFIFMVHQPGFTEEMIVEDTNIDQSILEDLFSMEHATRTELPFDDISEEWDKLLAEGVLSIENFDEEVAAESDSNTVDTECTDLPDLSEYESMLDWGDNIDSE